MFYRKRNILRITWRIEAACFIKLTILSLQNSFLKSNMNKRIDTKIRSFVNSSTREEIKCKEFKIPIPYGHIAAKAWGHENGQPVLALHGWLDNANTFDTLIPLLCKDLYVVAIDIPGHGLSSHRPSGCFYNYLNVLQDLKRVPDCLKWTNFDIIGHSMGGALSTLYASIFPENVRKIVVLDIYKVTSRKPEDLPSLARKILDENALLEKKCTLSPPIYSEAEAIKRLKRGMFDEITEDSAKILIKRGTLPSKCGNGLIFSRDLRCRTVEGSHKFTHDTLKSFMTQLQCEMLLIISKNTHPMYRSACPEVIPEFLDIYEKHCKKFIKLEVEGNHFVHLNHPDRIASSINKFLCSDEDIYS